MKQLKISDNFFNIDEPNLIYTGIDHLNPPEFAKILIKYLIDHKLKNEVKNIIKNID